MDRGMGEGGGGRGSFKYWGKKGILKFFLLLLEGGVKGQRILFLLIDNL